MIKKCLEQTEEIEKLNLEKESQQQTIQTYEKEIPSIQKEHLRRLREMQEQYVEKLTVKQSSSKRGLLSKHEVDKAISQIQQLKEETVLKLKDEIAQSEELKVELNRCKIQIINVKNTAITANQRQFIIAKDLKDEKLKVKKYKVMEEKYEELLTKYIILEKNNNQYKIYADSEISRLTLQVITLIKENNELKSEKNQKINFDLILKKDQYQINRKYEEKPKRVIPNNLKKKTVRKEIINKKDIKKIKHVKCRRCLTGMNYNISENFLVLITCTNKQKIGGKLCIMAQCVHHKICMYFNSKKMTKTLIGNPPWKCPICFKKALNYFRT